MRGLPTLIAEVDELWSFIGIKEARVDPAKHPAWFGDAYTFIGLDALAKAVISYHVGKRTAEDADIFARDFRARLTMVPHLSTDGFNAYPGAFAAHFPPGGLDYGTAVKHYRSRAQRGPDHRYEPPRDPFITKHTVLGAPVEELTRTAYVERYNLTHRHTVGRTRRLCLAFSKTLRGHVAGTALGICAYNFVKEHSTLGKHVTPAMALGLVDRPWTIRDLVEAALEAREHPAEPVQPGPLSMPSQRGGYPVGAARPLPGGGFLRSVPGAAPPAKGAPPAPPPAPVQAPPAPAVVAVAAPAPASPEPVVPDPQLDLFTWRPRPSRRDVPVGTQLGLFGEDQCVGPAPPLPDGSP
jgi:IS1 family transposase